MRWLMLATLLAVNGSSRASDSALSFDGFRDDRDQAVSAATLQKPAELIVFGYVSCPDVCPLTLLAVHRALIQLGAAADDVDCLFVTVDPARDTFAVLHRYVGAFDPRIRGLHGDETALQRFTRRLDARYQRRPTPGTMGGYTMDHTATLFVLQRDGRIAARIPHVDNPEKLSAAIAMALNATLNCVNRTTTDRSLCLPP